MDTQTMTISTDTLRTVIEIVPDWEIEGDMVQPPWTQLGPSMSVHNPSTIILDALAAAATEVIDAIEDTHVSVIPSASEIWRRTDIVHEGERCVECIAHSTGKGRTNNTLTAIAEFVKSGGFDG